MTITDTLIAVLLALEVLNFLLLFYIVRWTRNTANRLIAPFLKKKGVKEAEEGELDLEALAKQFGVDPSVVKTLASKYLGGDAQPDVLTGILGKFVKGEQMGVEDLIPLIPTILKELRTKPAGGAGKPSTGGERW